MTTKDGEHLSKVVSSGEEDAKSPASVPGHTSKELYFAELRANEFMGSLLVPRQRLNLAVEELASKYEVTIRRAPSLDPELPGQSMYLTADGDMGFFDMESLQKALATRFGVNRRFIAVRIISLVLAWVIRSCHQGGALRRKPLGSFLARCGYDDGCNSKSA